ncbi:MAG: ketosteroid isomerase-like protein [Gammaproteobacteria bacterium]|jgi:ketosteroid isomerase-like protein
MKDDKQAVLNANDEFYSTFSNNDFVSMEELWSVNDNISVIHPGWPPLTGHHSVISSWKRIMDGGNSPNITCINANVNLSGDIAIVICTELLAGAKLVATNIFALEQGSWKLIHHQAGLLHQSNNNKEGDTLH